MPRGTRPSKPKVFLSDEAMRPEDVLPPVPEFVAVGDVPLEAARQPIPDGDHNSDPGRPQEDEPDDGDDGEFEPVPDEDIPDEDDETQSPPPAEEGDQPPAPASGKTAATPAPADRGSEAPAPVAAQPTAPLEAPVVTYRSRISVVEAWRYPGSLSSAPDFIDRSWTGWADEDQLIGKPSGPALRVPVPRSITYPEGMRLCRVGDYVVRQTVCLMDGVDSDVMVDVWPKEEFERMFMPVTDLKKQKLRAA